MNKVKKVKTLCKISLVSIALILFLVSSTALAATENDTGNATVKDNYVSSTSLSTTEESAPLQTTETQISTSGYAGSPAIYGNKIVWQDVRNDYKCEIYMYDLSTKKETQITIENTGSNHAICGDKIVYSGYLYSRYLDSRYGDPEIYPEIYIYDLSTKKETKINTTSGSDYPVIYGNRIVYASGGNIYMYDLSTSKETQITSSPDDQRCPAMYGNRIVWQDDGGEDDGYTNHGIFMYDISTKKKMRISPTELAYNPAIYGNRIVYSSDRNGNEDIYMYDLSTKKETQITSSPDAQTHPAIYENRIVWQDDGGEDDGGTNHGIFMYDISTKKKMRISPTELAYDPAIYGNRIVYSSYRNENQDIYMRTI